MNQIPKKNIEDFFNILGFYRRQKWPFTTFFQEMTDFLMLSSHFTALDLYGKRILNNLVISLSLISQAQG